MKAKTWVEIEVTRDGSSLVANVKLDTTGIFRKIFRAAEEKGKIIDRIEIEYDLSIKQMSNFNFNRTALSTSASSEQGELSINMELDKITNSNNTSNASPKSSFKNINTKRGKEEVKKEKVKSKLTKKFQETNNTKRVLSKKTSSYAKLPDEIEVWNSSHFATLISYLFKKRYGINSMEVSPNTPNRARIWTVIKQNLINRFLKDGFTKAELKEYIEWVFEVPSHNIEYPVTLGFLFSSKVMTSWVVERSGKTGTRTGNSKWEKLSHSAKKQV